MSEPNIIIRYKMDYRYSDETGQEVFRDSMFFSRGIQEDIVEVYMNHLRMLLDKNTKYGNSALEPLGVFAKGGAEASLFTRLDDKLNRIKNSDELRKNDVSDLVGYLMLLMVHKRWLDFSEIVD